MKNDYPHLAVSPDIRQRMVEVAGEFRKVPTEGEKILWNALRGKKLDGIKFRRQQPIGYFVVDFYNSPYRLVLEVDGPIHQSQKEVDAARQEILEVLGLNVVRIETEIIEKNIPKALEISRSSIRTLLLNQNIPSPIMGEGQGRG